MTNSAENLKFFASLGVASMSGTDLLLAYLNNYSPILIFIILALAFGLVTLALSYLLQPKYPEYEKLSVYEK